MQYSGYVRTCGAYRAPVLSTLYCGWSSKRTAAVRAVLVLSRRCATSAQCHVNAIPSLPWCKAHCGQQMGRVMPKVMLTGSANDPSRMHRAAQPNSTSEPWRALLCRSLPLYALSAPPLLLRHSSCIPHSPLHLLPHPYPHSPNTTISLCRPPAALPLMLTPTPHKRLTAHFY